MWQGLLTDEMHRAGFGVTMDDDFVWLWCGKNSIARLIAVWLYDTATIKEVRAAAKKDIENEHSKNSGTQS